MKAGGTASKAEVTAEVATLISLKGQLATAQGADATAASDKDKKKNKKGGGGGKENTKPPTAPAVAPSQPSAPADEAEVNRLQALVTQQVGGHSIQICGSSSCQSSGHTLNNPSVTFLSAQSPRHIPVIPVSMFLSVLIPYCCQSPAHIPVSAILKPLPCFRTDIKCPTLQ